MQRNHSANGTDRKQNPHIEHRFLANCFNCGPFDFKSKRIKKHNSSVLLPKFLCATGANLLELYIRILNSDIDPGLVFKLRLKSFCFSGVLFNKHQFVEFLVSDLVCYARRAVKEFLLVAIRGLNKLDCAGSCERVNV